MWSHDMNHDAALIINVDIREESGVYFADSRDLPGLHICGRTAQQTCATVIKAVKALFKHNRNMDVEVVPATDDSESFPEIQGLCERFVVQRARA